MYRILRLSDGREVKVDEEDYEVLVAQEWVTQELTTRGGGKRIFIKEKNCGKKHKFLHRFLFPNYNEKFTFTFSNGDEFDYRKENLIFFRYLKKKTSEHTGTEYKKIEEERKKLKILAMNNQVCVIKAHAIISPGLGRELECMICLETDHECKYYVECLGVAGRLKWNGFRPIKGERCEWAKRIVEIEKAKEDKIKEGNKKWGCSLVST